LTGLNVRIAFLRVEATAGTNVHTTFGGSGSQITWVRVCGILKIGRSAFLFKKALNEFF